MFRDVAPVTVAASAAWWTTVRGAGASDGGALPRSMVVAALFGIVASSIVTARAPKRLPAVALATFVAPCAAAWFTASESITAATDPLELLLGSLAWVVFGTLLVRPTSVVRSSEGRPTQGTLTPRHPLPVLGRAPLLVAALFGLVIAYEALRTSTAHPDRAVLARVVATVIVLALFAAAGDIAGRRHGQRVVSSPSVRARRAVAPLALLVALLFLGVAYVLRDS